MPFKSRQQAKLMYAAAQKDTDKVPQDVAKKFIKESKGMDFKRLKKYVTKKKESK